MDHLYSEHKRMLTAVKVIKSMHESNFSVPFVSFFYASSLELTFHFTYNILSEIAKKCKKKLMRAKNYAHITTHINDMSRQVFKKMVGSTRIDAVSVFGGRNRNIRLDMFG